MSEVILYTTPEGDAQVDVRLDEDTVWLSTEQMAALFGRERSVITKHLKNIFKEGELPLESNVQNLHIAGAAKPVRFYQLDVIISVGYRVNSKRGTQFRQWATRTLRDHLVRGFTVNQRRLADNTQELAAALELVRRTAAAEQLTLDQGRGLVDVITRYTRTYLLLQQYDDGSLTEPKGRAPAFTLATQVARAEIARLKADLAARGEATALFGRERADALDALLGNLEQTAFGEPAYPTVESKAAHLLYFVIKDHPLSDGNKRVGACLFLYFLERNGALLRKDGTIKLNDVGMAALALLVAESSPASKDVVIRLVMNILAEPTA